MKPFTIPDGQSRLKRERSKQSIFNAEMNKLAELVGEDKVREILSTWIAEKKPIDDLISRILQAYSAATNK